MSNTQHRNGQPLYAAPMACCGAATFASDADEPGRLSPWHNCCPHLCRACWPEDAAVSARTHQMPQAVSETDCFACSLVCAAAVSACSFSCFRRHSAPMTAALVWVCCSLAWALFRWARASCAWAAAVACCTSAASLCCSSCAAKAARSALSFPCTCSATTYTGRVLVEYLCMEGHLN